MRNRSNTARRLDRIKRLAGKYFLLGKGELIARPEELLKIMDIEKPSYVAHPHRSYRTYISRRALKHVVETRKEDLGKSHDNQHGFERICFAIDSIPDIIMDFDRYELEPKEHPAKHFYTKHYAYSKRPSVRILVEQKENTLEIRSIHFRMRVSPK